MSPLDVNQINKAGYNAYNSLIGIEFTEWGDGKCSAKLEARKDLFHAGGLVHGGAAFSLADSTMAHALISVMESGQYCSTVELKISYLEAVRDGTLVCTSKVVRRGRRIAFLESEVLNNELVVAKATATFAIMEQR